MIDRDEIDAKADEFEIHTSDLQRDYVFGWLLFAIYNNAHLSNLLVLKGGNCFRKAYFPNTRFSSDLDFSTQQALDLERFALELNECCSVAQDASGIQFMPERNSIAESARANQGRNTDRKIYKGKVFFKDFYGENSSIEISVRMDVTEFDKLYMEPVNVPLIHPYTDADACQVDLRCVAIEEGIASKLKCLIQRRHSHDLYDLVYAAFFNDSIELNRAEIARVFLRKTIFGDSPGSARQILLGLPVPVFKAAWERYIVCPVQSRLDFEKAQSIYSGFIESVFGAVAGGSQWVSDAFYPAELRNVFLEAGAERKLIRLQYDGVTRLVEPYALVYKRPSGRRPREYFYVWDRVGGSSGPGIKTLVNPKVVAPEITDESFEPRFEIELSKAGENSGKGYFGGGRTSARRSTRNRRPRSSAYSGGPKYVVECSYCRKQFKRKKADNTLRPHKDKSGRNCPGRHGYSLGWRY